MSEGVTFVGADAAAAKIARIRAIPGVVEEADQVYAEMTEADLEAVRITPRRGW